MMFIDYLIPRRYFPGTSFLGGMTSKFKVIDDAFKDQIRFISAIDEIRSHFVIIEPLVFRFEELCPFETLDALADVNVVIALSELEIGKWPIELLIRIKDERIPVGFNTQIQELILKRIGIWQRFRTCDPLSFRSRLIKDQSDVRITSSGSLDYIKGFHRFVILSSRIPHLKFNWYGGSEMWAPGAGSPSLDAYAFEIDNLTIIRKGEEFDPSDSYHPNDIWLGLSDHDVTSYAHREALQLGLRSVCLDRHWYREQPTIIVNNLYEMEDKIVHLIESKPSRDKRIKPFLDTQTPSQWMSDILFQFRRMEREL